jgi:16S rRNA (guanine527-N7)-methyltransferase
MGEGGLAGRIAERAMRAGAEVDASLAGALAAYVELLGRWNRRMNLTSVAEDDHGLDRLVVEPVVAARQLPAGVRWLVDIGSGGGSPAVPLKLALPSVGLRMVEARQRKAAFLREVVRQLALEDVVVEACRYQELVGRRDVQGTVDVVTVRAVRVDAQALDSLQLLLKPGGSVFLFCGAGDCGVRDDLSGTLRWRGSYPLVQANGSRLVALERC